MEIFPDPFHVAALTLPFFVALIGGHLILWRPLLEWIDERDALSESARKEATELEQAAVEHLDRIEERLRSAHNEVGTVRQEARQRALAHEGELIAAAKQSADQKVTEAVAKIQSERDVARQALNETATELSSHIAARVLGRGLA